MCKIVVIAVVVTIVLVGVIIGIIFGVAPVTTDDVFCRDVNSPHDIRIAATDSHIVVTWGQVPMSEICYVEFELALTVNGEAVSNITTNVTNFIFTNDFGACASLSVEITTVSNTGYRASKTEEFHTGFVNIANITVDGGTLSWSLVDDLPGCDFEVVLNGEVVGVLDERVVNISNLDHCVLHEIEITPVDFNEMRGQTFSTSFEKELDYLTDFQVTQQNEVIVASWLETSPKCAVLISVDEAEPYVAISESQRVLDETDFVQCTEYEITAWYQSESNATGPATNLVFLKRFQPITEMNMTVDEEGVVSAAWEVIGNIEDCFEIFIDFSMDFDCSVNSDETTINPDKAMRDATAARTTTDTPTETTTDTTTETTTNTTTETTIYTTTETTTDTTTDITIEATTDSTTETTTDTATETTTDTTTETTIYTTTETTTDTTTVATTDITIETTTDIAIETTTDTTTETTIYTTTETTTDTTIETTTDIAIEATTDTTTDTTTETTTDTITETTTDTITETTADTATETITDTTTETTTGTTTEATTDTTIETTTDITIETTTDTTIETTTDTSTETTADPTAETTTEPSSRNPIILNYSFYSCAIDEIPTIFRMSGVPVTNPPSIKVADFHCEYKVSRDQEDDRIVLDVIGELSSWICPVSSS